MAKLINDENTIEFHINFAENSIDYASEILDFVKYHLKLHYGEETIEYSDNKTISLRTLQYLIINLSKIIDIKNKREDLKEVFEINPLDNSFFMKIQERGIEDLVLIEIWFNIGMLTGGKIIGFSKGVKFDCTINSLQKFCTEIQNELFNVTNSNLF